MKDLADVSQKSGIRELNLLKKESNLVNIVFTLSAEKVKVST